MLILVALAVVTIGGIVIARKAAKAGAAAIDLAKSGAWAVTPWNQDNVIYGGVNSAGAAVTGDSNFTLGGWIYDVTHPDPMAPKPVVNTGGATGSW